MTEMPPPVDFDSRPPMPVSEYEQTVKRVNVGYDFMFTLAGCMLRALGRPDLDLLVVGAGGGAEIARFLPDNPGWRLTGVDPSEDMLALAWARAASLGVRERVTLLRGTVQDLPAGARYDAATCIFVLHFLPDDGKLGLLRDIAARLQPGAPLLVAMASRGDDAGLEADFLGAWQAYGELMGMPAQQMAQTIERLKSQPRTDEADYARLLYAAGFQRAACFLSVLGGMSAWLAR